MNKPLIISLFIVVLDTMGVWLVMPVLPTLLGKMVSPGHIAMHYGVLLSLYALMQIFFAPVLGQLSDKYGRRPVLLLSLLGAAVDYVIMATTPILGILYIGRIISGITGATGTIAASTIADTTSDDTRARAFGFMGAAFGIGMIAGPAIGGLLAGLSVQAPFIAAALLNAAGFILTALFLSESRQNKKDKPPTPVSLNPFNSIRLIRTFKGMVPMIRVFFILQVIGQVPAALWVIYGQDRFHWDVGTVGVSLAVFGALHAGVQAFITGPLSKRLGERRTLLVGIVADGTGYILMAFATQGWMVIPILLLLAFGSVGTPALQAMLSKGVSDDHQGALQGTLTSLNSLSSIIAPLVFTALYTATLPFWAGWVWIAGAALYAVCVPAVQRLRLQSSSM